MGIQEHRHLLSRLVTNRLCQQSFDLSAVFAFPFHDFRLRERISFEPRVVICEHVAALEVRIRFVDLGWTLRTGDCAYDGFSITTNFCDTSRSTMTRQLLNRARRHIG